MVLSDHDIQIEQLRERYLILQLKDETDTDDDAAGLTIADVIPEDATAKAVCMYLADGNGRGYLQIYQATPVVDVYEAYALKRAYHWRPPQQHHSS